MSVFDDPAYDCLWRQLAQPLEPDLVADAYDRLFTSISRRRWRSAAPAEPSARAGVFEQRIDMTLAA